jgi:hypothetical protein
MYHVMGIDSHTVLPGRLGQPFPELVFGGKVLTQMLG